MWCSPPSPNLVGEGSKAWRSHRVFTLQRGWPPEPRASLRGGASESHLGPVWATLGPLLLSPCSETPAGRPPPAPRPRGLADSTFVWTMPGLWSLRCSRVAAMSISLAPATTHTGELRPGARARCPHPHRLPSGRGPVTLAAHGPGGQPPRPHSSGKTRRAGFCGFTRGRGLGLGCRTPAWSSPESSLSETA